MRRKNLSPASKLEKKVTQQLKCVYSVCMLHDDKNLSLFVLDSKAQENQIKLSVNYQFLEFKKNHEYALLGLLEVGTLKGSKFQNPQTIPINYSELTH